MRVPTIPKVMATDENAARNSNASMNRSFQNCNRLAGDDGLLRDGRPALPIDAEL